jgi:hypothetical protein
MNLPRPEGRGTGRQPDAGDSHADLLLSGAEVVAVPGFAGKAGALFLTVKRQQAYSVRSDFEGSGPQLDTSAGCRSVRRMARGFSLLGEALINAFTQLAGTELSSRTDFRNKVAGTASKAPRVPRA